jgi:hypothetical protein
VLSWFVRHADGRLAFPQWNQRKSSGVPPEPSLALCRWFDTAKKEVLVMTSVKKMLLGVTAGAAILASSAITASAAVVCSGNTCWHTHERYTYPPSAGVVIHEDDWRAGPGITFREHEGRGYWRGETWTDF